MELLYTVCNGDLLNGSDKAMNMLAEDFLTIASYLLEKKSIEDKEHKSRIQKMKGGY